MLNQSEMPQVLQANIYQNSAERLKSEDHRDLEEERHSGHKNEALDESLEIGSQKKQFICFTEQQRVSPCLEE